MRSKGKINRGNKNANNQINSGMANLLLSNKIPQVQGKDDSVKLLKNPAKFKQNQSSDLAFEESSESKTIIFI